MRQGTTRSSRVQGIVVILKKKNLSSSPYLVTLAAGFAGVKAEVAPRVKRKAKRDRKGAIVKVWGPREGQVAETQVVQTPK